MSHPFRILNPSLRSREFAGKCALAVMAKAPLPGKVKTRLSPPLTSEQASALNACFLRDTIENLEFAATALPADWVISYTPVGEEDAFRGILPSGALLLPQRGDGFGRRLLSTAEDLFACGFSAVCLIDSDSPTVPTAEFARAVRILLDKGKHAVLGPSEDGGYYLIGLQEPSPYLFESIPWSTSVVMEQTLDRAREIFLPVELLHRWYDVDDEAFLDQLFAELFASQASPSGYPAPHTRQYLARMNGGLSSTPAALEKTV